MMKIHRIIMLLIIAGISLPILTYILTTVNCPLPIETNSDWIGYWGSYFGTIIACSISYVVLIYTIKENRRQYLWNKKWDNINQAAKDFSDALSFASDKVLFNLLYGKEHADLSRYSYQVLLEYKLELEKSKSNIYLLYHNSYPDITSQYEDVTKKYIKFLDDILLLMSEVIRYKEDKSIGDEEKQEQLHKLENKIYLKFRERTNIKQAIIELYEMVNTVIERKKAELIDEQKNIRF